MGNKRKSNSRNPAAPVATGQSPLLAGLAEHHRLRQRQRGLLPRLDPTISAFDEVLAHLKLVASSDGLDPELVHLLEQAQGWVISGIDRMISNPDPHAAEEARLLLELEYLLKDFAATPSNIGEWARVDEWSRPSKFGFGKLRQREERRQSLDGDTVIAARDYWIAHSSDSHPKPLKDETPPARHWSFSLLSSLGDLHQHALAVVDAAWQCVLVVGATTPAELDDLQTSATAKFAQRAQEVLNSDIPDGDLDELWQPGPKKRSPRKFWLPGVDQGSAAGEEPC